tara:strand:- start:989 stop:1339 length:351 start_codon:yes stop_codon:yes gene_type:complete
MATLMALLVVLFAAFLITPWSWVHGATKRVTGGYIDVFYRLDYTRRPKWLPAPRNVGRILWHLPEIHRVSCHKVWWVKHHLTFKVVRPSCQWMRRTGYPVSRAWVTEKWQEWRAAH